MSMSNIVSLVSDMLYYFIACNYQQLFHYPVATFNYPGKKGTKPQQIATDVLYEYRAYTIYTLPED